MELHRSRPYRPATNGKAERLNLTLEREWANATNHARLADLPAWLHHTGVAVVSRAKQRFR
jgi:transposase InsO family protein